MVCDVEAYIFTVTDVTIFDGGTRALTTHAYCRTHCRARNQHECQLQDQGCVKHESISNTHENKKKRGGLLSTCACAANDAVVNNGATVDRDL